MANEIHVGDIGTAFIAEILKPDGSVHDVSEATTKEIIFKRPSGETMVKSASLVNTGADGLIQYITVEDDLDEAGNWSVQGRIAMNGGLWHSNISKFKVYRNLI